MDNRYSAFGSGTKCDLVVAMCISNQLIKKKISYILWGLDIEKPTMYIHCNMTFIMFSLKVHPFYCGEHHMSPVKIPILLWHTGYRPKGEFSMQLKLVVMFVNIFSTISEFYQLTTKHLYLVSLLLGLVFNDSNNFVII